MTTDNNPTRLEKGDEFWYVQLADWRGILETPDVRHGIVTGGGDRQIIVKWDHNAEPLRQSRIPFQSDVHRTRQAALADAEMRLRHKREEAQQTVLRATVALAAVELLKAQEATA